MPIAPLFGSFAFDRDSSRVLKNGQVVLHSANGRIFCRMYDKRPEIVSKRELIEVGWSVRSTQGRESSLYQAISEIRVALGDKQPWSLILSESGVGYGLALPTTLVSAHALADTVNSPKLTVPMRTQAQSTPSSAPHALTGLQELLIAWGVPANPALNEAATKRRLNAKLVMGNVILHDAFGGYQGVPADEIAIEPSVHASPRLPKYVYDARERIKPRGQNRPSVFFDGWQAPVEDANEPVTLNLGWIDESVIERVFNYHTCQAIMDVAGRIQDDVLARRQHLDGFGRQLNAMSTVLTTDGRILLGKRNSKVASGQGHWMATVGEIVDSEWDSTDGIGPHPVNAVRRCLQAKDELNIEAAYMRHARITFLALVTQWTFLYLNIAAFVEVNATFDQVYERWTSGEIVELEGVPFTLESCLPLVRDGHYVAPKSNQAEPLEETTRLVLLLALIRTFGHRLVEDSIRSQT